MIEDKYYYGSFEDEWFEHRKKLEKIEEQSWQKRYPRDFSGDKPDTPDYDPWTDSYY